VIPQIGTSIGNHHSAAEDLLVLDQDKEEAASVLPRLPGIKSGNSDFIAISSNGQNSHISLRDTSTEPKATSLTNCH
jgi:hypothetical protein